MTTQDLSLRAGGLARRLLHRIAALAGEVLRRRKFKRLQDLDDHILDDIGVTRAEVEIATRLPFTHDAATELRRMSLDRRRREKQRLSPDAASALYQRTVTPRRRL